MHQAARRSRDKFIQPRRLKILRKRGKKMQTRTKEKNVQCAPAGVASRRPLNDAPISAAKDEKSYRI